MYDENNQIFSYLQERRVKKESVCVCVAVVAATVLTGCAVQQRDWYQPEISLFSLPKVDEVVRAGLGEPLLTQGETRTYDAVYIAAPLAVGQSTLPAGYYLKESSLSNFAYFRPGEDVQQELSRSGKTIKRMAVLNDGRMCVELPPTGISCPDGYKAQLTKWSVTGPVTGGFQRTLIYSGRVGNKINVVYRESSDGYARPAFDNRIEYDLTESSVIGYKGARLEVIEATNQQIKYKVLRNFEGFAR